MVVLASPLLPLATLADLVQGHAVSAIPSEAERTRFHFRLAAVLARPEVREALYAGRPGWFAALTRWEAGTASTGRQDLLARVLFRALQGLATATEPEGLSVGVALGLVGDASVLELGPREHYGRVTRLDVGILEGFAEALNLDPERAQGFTLRPNPSAYEVSGELWFLARSASSGALTEVRRVLDALERRIYEAAEGGATVQALSRDADPKCIERLLREQVLVSDFAPPIMGTSPVPALAEDLALAGQGQLSRALRDFEHAVGNLDQGGLGHPPERYEILELALAALPGTQVQTPRRFHVELSKCAEGLSLGQNVVREVLAGAEALRRMSRADDGLATFIERFQERYAEHAAPLLEVLDAGDSLGLGLEGPPSSPFDFTPAERRREARLRKQLAAVQRDSMGISSLTVSMADLEALEEAAPRPLDSMHVKGAILAASSGHVERGDYFIRLDSVGRMSGASSLVRLAHLDPQMLRAARELNRAEASLRPEALLADVVCWPRGRNANRMLRPGLRPHAISLLARAAVGDSEVISLKELTVQVVAGRVVLRSTRLAREILPRLGHPRELGPMAWTAYRFLANVECPDGGDLGWQWGGLCDEEVLPRVMHGRCVLSPARFRLSAARCEEIRRSRVPALALEAERRRAGAPQWCRLTRGARRQVVDFANVLSVEAAVSALPRRGDCALEEAYLSPEHLPLRGPEGCYAHAFILPVLRRGPAGSG